MGASDEDREDWQTVAETVRARRSRRKLTQQQLADVTGLGVQTIRNIEAGRLASRRDVTLHRIEDALGWPHGTLLQIATGKTAPVADFEARLRALEDAMPSLRTRVNRIVDHLSAIGDIDPTDTG